MALPAWMYICFWIFFSCAMILFNKSVLDTFHFPFPMFLTTWHMFLATILTQIMSRTTNMLPGVAEVLFTMRIFPSLLYLLTVHNSPVYKASTLYTVQFSALLLFALEIFT